MTPERLDAAAADQARAALRRALAVAVTAPTALDAVVAAVAVLEDDEAFNAGRGAALTAAGTVEHDASVMDGATGRAGAVACICGPRNPVAAAWAVMDTTPHVLLAGEGAEAVARAAGLPFEEPGWFLTATPPIGTTGTVGAVALDDHGRLAAATSTGGKAGQAVGRIGDSPLIGAGTWADGAVAVSGTGDGEAFIRRAFAHEVAAQVRLAGVDVSTACERALAGVRGGCIAIDATGTVVMPFTTDGMHRGWIDGSDGVARVAIFEGEEPA